METEVKTEIIEEIKEPETPVQEAANDEAPKEGKKSKKPLIIALSVVLALLLIGGIIYLIYARNPRIMIAKAFVNTFGNIGNGDNELLTDLNPSKILKGEDYTLSFNVDTELSEVGDTMIEGDLIVNNEMVELSGDVEISYLPVIEYAFWLDESELKAYFPLLPGRLFAYDYHSDNTGYISEKIDTATVNEFIDNNYEFISNPDESSEAYNVLNELIKEDYLKLSFERTADASYTIDAEDISARGYKTTITTSMLKSYGRDLESWINKYYKNAIENIGFSAKEIYNAIDTYADEAGDITLTVYIYKNKLAAVKVSSNKGDEELIFEGGDYRFQNISLTTTDGTKIYVAGNENNDIENIFTAVNGKDVLSYAYNTSDGSLKIKLNGRDEITAKIKRVNDSVSIDLDYFDLGDSYIGGTLSLKEGTKYSEPSGERFDIGNASEDEIEVIKNEINEVIDGIIYR